MIDDLKYGSRNKRGDWKPAKPQSYPPLFVWPAKPVAFLKWFFGWGGYLMPWSMTYAAITVLIWTYLTPSFDWIRSDYWWIACLLIRNLAIILAVYGAWHLALYIKKTQGKAFKYNANWPSNDNAAFLFGRQNVDNMIWSLLSGVPIFTMYEAGFLWLLAHGYVPLHQWMDHPLLFTVSMILVPMIYDVHFYLVHRFLHWPPLYRVAHSLHHNNVNPGPWSGLAMHPIEHVMYFSGFLVYLLIPTHPIIPLFHLYSAAMGPAQGHVGFDKVVVGDNATMETGCYRHYLHHKYFECNYADGTVPLDKWFGTFHDGSEEAQAWMDKRFLDRMQAKKNKEANTTKGNSA